MARKRKTTKKRRTKRKSFSGLGSVKQSFSPAKIKSNGLTMGMTLAGLIGGIMAEKQFMPNAKYETGVKKFLPAVALAGGGLILSGMQGKNAKFLSPLGIGLIMSGSLSGIEAVTGNNILNGIQGFNLSGLGLGLGKALDYNADNLLPDITDVDTPAEPQITGADEFQENEEFADYEEVIS